MENFSYTDIEDDQVVSRHRPHPRFRRLAFHLAGAEELDIPSEMKLVGRAQDHSRPQAASRAMQTLVASHMAFLQGIADKVAFKNNMAGAEEDLLSEAISSFIRTIRRYRGEAHGARLATFATYTVSGDLMTYALRNRHIYAVGTSSPDRVMIFGYDDFVETFEIEQKMSFDKDNPEHIRLLSVIAEVSERTVRRVCAQRAAGPTLDVDQIEIEDPDPKSDPEHQILQDSTAAFAQKIIGEVRSKMSSRNRSILDALIEDQSSAYAMVACEHGVTPERVGQIYRSAMNDIRDRLQRAGITSA